MGSIVVHDDMDVQMGRRRCVDLVEEFAELDGAMPTQARSQDLAGLHVQGGKERVRAVPGIVMAAAFHLPWTHRQQRLHTVKRLDLGFFINTQNQSFVWRTHVEPHDISDLFDEQGVSGELEALSPMQL